MRITALALVSALAVSALAFSACAPKNPIPTPQAKSAYVFSSNFTAGALDALDVAGTTKTAILTGDGIGSDSFVRTFGEVVYVVSRDYVGANNSLTVIEGNTVTAQHPLGEGVNAYDLWAVSKTKAYFTAQPNPSAPAAKAYALRNSVSIINPSTGALGATIDIGAALTALGDLLPSEDTDDYYELNALWADDAHLFVSIQAFGEFYSIIGKDDACGQVAGRVAVIDLATDRVVKIIPLRGANPAARFVPEPGTNNLLVATAGSLGTHAIDPCAGIERINQATLTHEGYYLTEAQLGGSVVSFDVDANGMGGAFLFTAGDFLAPTYEVVRFSLQDQGRVGAPLVAPGPSGFLVPSFARLNDKGELYVGLPFSGSKPVIGRFSLETGAALSAEVELEMSPVDVAFLPGTPFRR